ncbi:MAG: hypothetical protein KC464_33675, partial [Myxococcales bacterium]|nr:hypothetical protein [Myxococcales bacterium]
MQPPVIRRPRIMSGRRVLLICFGFVAVLGGLGGWWMVSERPRTGPYLDVLALDGEYAVAIRHERTHDRAYVELFGTHEGLRWQALVPRYRVPDGALGVAASAHAVTVRFPRDGRTQIFGFATATAQKLGTVSLGLDLAKEPDGQTPAELATLPADDQSFEFIQPDDGPTRVYQLTVLQGRIGWERDLPAAGVGSAWITRDRLVVEQPASTTSIDRATGVAWTLDASRSCTVDAADGAPGVVLLAQPGALVVVGLDDGAATERIALRDGDEFAGLCGRRGDRLVALMEYQGAPELWLWRTGERPTAIPLGSGSVIGFDA